MQEVKVTDCYTFYIVEYADGYKIAIIDVIYYCNQNKLKVINKDALSKKITRKLKY